MRELPYHYEEYVEGLLEDLQERWLCLYTNWHDHTPWERFKFKLDDKVFKIHWFILRSILRVGV
jgi:hypothetical protein